MKRTTLAIVTMTIALIGTNLGWDYVVIDRSITQAYSSQVANASAAALAEALAALPVATKPETTQEQLTAAVRGAAPAADTYEKDGFVWVGHLGLRFDARGKLIQAVAN